MWLPASLSLLKEEGESVISFAPLRLSMENRSIVLPFCNNREQKSLQYFCGEGEEAYRIDLCDKCRQYIKTVDYRNLEESDPVLEDLATLHLDILASQKDIRDRSPTPDHLKNRKWETRIESDGQFILLPLISYISRFPSPYD